MQVINLFVRTFFKNPILNLDLINKGFFNNKIQGSNEFIYFGENDVYTSKVFKFILNLKKNFFS